MAMPVERARQVLKRLEAVELESLYAQAEAQLVLHEVGETPENFPNFAEGLDSRVTSLAYLYLSAGCSLAEQGERREGADALERAARLVRSVHAPHAKSSRDSAYHMLLASMAAYAAGQYSWAFVMMQQSDAATATASLLACFLRRDRVGLQSAIGGILLDARDVAADAEDGLETGFARAVARALAFASEFCLTGERENLERARGEIDDALAIATSGMSPAWWWVARILGIMLADLADASPWTTVPPYFGGLAPEDNPVPAYIQMLAFDERPVLELWRSQREALPSALGKNRGAVVSLKTSGGKTRVAELAMMQALSAETDAKVFYLAPFRSLAFELEQTLGRTFRPLGYTVSHLYGGARASRSDSELISDTRVIVATPEKARAIFRAEPDLFLTVRLFVVDEGHLLGGSERDVRNELYLEHLRVRAARTGARFLLLSAVLPNADEIAEWIAGEAKSVGTSPWRPSLARFGLLRWNGAKARIDWRGEHPSFNPEFVSAAPTSTRAKAKMFPSKKSEAVAAAAVRLWAGERPVLIFVAQATHVEGIAKSVLKSLSMESQAMRHEWPDQEWKAFETLCREELPPQSTELAAAELGVICHSNNLPSQVRIATERLMRSHPPRIVIATSTLAQGVNIGVNTVIVASTVQGKGSFVGARDFWNIAGRAGRAFVDVEGKILYAVDDTKPAGKREAWRADQYFKELKHDPVISGVLQIVIYLKRAAARAAIPFTQLVEMAAEDDFARLGADDERTAGTLCDYLDDALLALQEDSVVNGLAEPPEAWIERTFRGSLAALQARTASSYEAEGLEVVAFVRARAQAAFRRAATPEKRKAVVSSNLPLTVALRLFDDLDIWRKMLDEYLSNADSTAMTLLVQRAEAWVRKNGSSLAERIPDAKVLDGVRAGWLAGTPLRDLCGKDRKSHQACREFYGFTLPWLLHAVSQQLREGGSEEEAEVYSEISLCVEMGLPSAHACQVFLAGVQSRAAAVEFSRVHVPLGDSIGEIGQSLRHEETVVKLRIALTGAASAWLDLIRIREGGTRERPPKFRPFSLPADISRDEAMFVRTARGIPYLSNTDGRSHFVPAPEATLPFGAIANDARFCFRFQDGAWHVTTRDPRLAHNQ